MWMCAGFTMLEAGSVCTKNASVICLKNVGLCSIAGLTFYLIGYYIMFTGVDTGGRLGTLDALHGATDAERALLGGDGSVKSTPPANVPEVTLGVFINWLGFLGFNGGSQLALDGAADAVAVANVLANANLAAAAGMATALILSRPVFGRSVSST